VVATRRIFHRPQRSGQWVNIQEAYINLIGAILAAGTEEPSYFTEECGRWWAELGGMNPEGLYRMAMASNDGDKPYSEISHREWSNQIGSQKCRKRKHKRPAMHHRNALDGV